MTDNPDCVTRTYEGSQMSEEMKVFSNQILALAKRGIEEFSVTTDNDVVIEVTLKATGLEKL